MVGLITGGFVARLGLESMGQPLPRLLVVAVGALSVIVGGAVAWRLTQASAPGGTRQGVRAWWALLMLGWYVVWPRREPSTALFLIILCGLTVFLDWNRRKVQLNSQSAPIRGLSYERMTDIFTFLTSLCFYLVTAAPDVLPADSAEFQLVASLGGMAHPPGYPLYTLLGWLFTKLLPFGNEAYRLNLMSAFLAAGALTLLGAATRRWARRLGAPLLPSLVGGLAAALALSTATTFWSQATLANIRMPTMLAATLALYALAGYVGTQDQRQAERALMLLALALGLGIGHHPSLIFLGIFFVVYLLLVDPRLLVQPRRWWKPLLVALLTLLPLLYLPLRGAADAPLAPPDLDTWDGFVRHVTAQGFEGDMFAFANAQDLPQRVTLVPTLFLFQFSPALLAAAALGLLVLAWRDWRLLILLAGGLILHTFVSITYRAPQTVEYLMPAYLPIAVSAGLTTAWLLSTLSPRLAVGSKATLFLIAVTSFLAASILLAGVANGLNHAPSFFALADDRSTREAMESILQPAPPDALILADWHWVTPLWYLQWVEGQRPDVEVRYVYPVPGQEYGDTWKDRIDAVIGEQPLLLTHAYEFPEYTLEPFGWGFWMHQRPHNAEPVAVRSAEASFSRSEEEGKVHFLGYLLDHQQASPGKALELTLAWQADGELATPPSFTVGLVDDEGQRWAQADRYLGTGHTSGEVRFERLMLPLYPNIPPERYDLIVQVYSAGDMGFETWSLESDENQSYENGTALRLTALMLQADTTRPLTLHPMAGPFIGGPTLIGVDYDGSMPGSVRLYLHWQGPAQGGEQVRVGETTALLPELAGDAFQTVVLDLPGEVTGRPWLTLTGTGDRTKAVAGPWGWPQHGLHLPAPSSGARFVPLADEMALVDVAPGESEAFARGDQLFLHLTFVALKPLVTDNAVSVRLLDEAGQWHYLHDIQPGLGAIPTLKWIRGSRVLDPHPLPIPHDMDGNMVRASMVVYERFRGMTRPPMDARLVDVPLGEWRLLGP